MIFPVLPQSVLKHAQRIVIKLGSSLVTNHGQGVDQASIRSWTTQIAALTQAGRDVIIVSSGAIAEGMKRLGWSQRPAEIHDLQAAAAVGQMGLARIYEVCFAEHDIVTAQVLLTRSDLSDRSRYLNARSTLRTLLQLRVVPVINENDTVVTDEIRFGDNDTLAALVTNLLEADVLVILTDQQGLFSADPRRQPDARLIDTAESTDPKLEHMAGGAGTMIGTGGMLTKILAAQRAARSGAHTIIAAGREPNVLTRLANGERIGTELTATLGRLAARKQWLADQLELRGRLQLDDGALHALLKEGKSLLPVGVCHVDGLFSRGDLVACVDRHGREVARGLINYGMDDAKKIMGKPSTAIVDLLGYVEEPELIHRDNLVLSTTTQHQTTPNTRTTSH